MSNIVKTYHQMTHYSQEGFTILQPRQQWMQPYNIGRAIEILWQWHFLRAKGYSDIPCRFACQCIVCQYILMAFSLNDIK